MASPRWQTNSNATAEISSADNGTTVSNVLSVKYSNRSPGPAPVSVRIVNKARLSLTGHFGGRNIHLQRPAISRFNGSPPVAN